MLGTLLPMSLLAFIQSRLRAAGGPADERGAAPHGVLLVGAADSAGDLQHALERGDRGPALLEEACAPDGLQAAGARLEGVFVSMALLLLPFVILYVLVKVIAALLDEPGGHGEPASRGFAGMGAP